MGGADLSDALAEVLSGVQRLIRRRLRRDLAGASLRGAQVELLWLVAASPGIGVSAAARELCLAGNSVSTLVNQLTAAGLLRRETDPGDRRSALLLPTPEAGVRLRVWRERRAALGCPAHPWHRVPRRLRVPGGWICCSGRRVPVPDGGWCRPVWWRCAWWSCRSCVMIAPSCSGRSAWPAAGHFLPCAAGLRGPARGGGARYHGGVLSAGEAGAVTAGGRPYGPAG